MKKMVQEKAKANNNGLMVLLMTAIEKMIRQMVKVYQSIAMEIFIMDRGLVIELMEMESTYIRMGLFIRDSEMKDDRQNGYGQEIWQDGAQYEGNYCDGTKNGQGKLKFLDGSSYEGEFKSNQI
eukprot:TRINITY_DN49704_c0_g1_i1.p2 TRINITY_DN49704_c0_g1~~TRINITY_DN49704_c0_g1_i1.p2  ORF type:complete len:124 (-),score=14.19 TRINITY_DN49704_c0_g1_i1:4-375(-)